MRNKLLFVIGLLVGLGLVAPLGATSVRIVSLEEMVQLADRVFRGRCLSAREIPGVAGLDAMEYTFEVSEGVKGVSTGEQVVFRQVLAAQVGKRGISGMPGYREGQDLLIFLHADSRLGLTSPVGFSQGVFQTVPDAEGVRVVNGVNNRNLMMGGVSPAADLGLSAEEVASLTQGGEMPLRTLTSAIRKIDRFQTANGRSAQ
jgi:hypothetical protein